MSYKQKREETNKRRDFTWSSLAIDAHNTQRVFDICKIPVIYLRVKRTENEQRENEG